MQQVLITGASRGIGLELTRQIAARGDHVFATCRSPQTAEALQTLATHHPEHITVLALDVTDDAQIEAAYHAVSARTGALDVLINNAGVFPRSEHLDTLDKATLLNTLHINAVGPLMVSRRFIDLLQHSDRPKLINITSQLGSISRKTSGGSYSYCGSKALLNMLTRALAFEVRPLGVTAIMLHPGWVQTDMGGSGASLRVEEAVAGMLRVIDGLTPEDTGRFLQWDGRELPW
ncbi:MAG: SDR family oxidoreductase [Anaerolineae bacterium]